VAVLILHLVSQGEVVGYLSLEMSKYVSDNTADKRAAPSAHALRYPVSLLGLLYIIFTFGFIYLLPAILLNWPLRHQSITGIRLVV
jgi:type II secretory pathway component PulF